MLSKIRTFDRPLTGYTICVNGSAHTIHVEAIPWTSASSEKDLRRTLAPSSNDEHRTVRVLQYLHRHAAKEYPVKVPNPLAPITIRSAFCLDATFMISSAGSPILQNGSAVNPAWINCCACCLTNLRAASFTFFSDLIHGTITLIVMGAKRWRAMTCTTLT